MTRAQIETMMYGAEPPARVVSALASSSGMEQVTYKQSPPGLLDIYFNVTYDRTGKVVDVTRMQL